MKISLYVHDFHLEVGHSRAMIELLNGLLPEQKNMITAIEVVAYSSSPLEKIFSDFKCPKKITLVPLNFIKPFLVKAIFYNLIALAHSIFIASKNTKIGIGIASWNVDIVNVQFIHKQWEEPYFKSQRLGLLKKIYKKILFNFFSFGEKIVYRSDKRQFLVIANFIKKGLIDNFGTKEKSIHLIPSGVNIHEFNFSGKTENDLQGYLKTNYPTLKGLDCSKPIVLFIGAYERKGLDRAVAALEKKTDYQFIIIGKPEQSSAFKVSQNPNYFFVQFTKEVHLFYELADIFIFPTRYEPFGLVIIEAYAMGLDIIVPKENVGASEIIQETDGIYFIDQKEEINLPPLKKVSRDLKTARRNQRLKIIADFSWENAARKFQSILFKN